jgi:hypothetical protein
MKFIPTSKFTTDNLSPTMDRLERDVHLKVFFAHMQDLDEEIPKLYVQCLWRHHVTNSPDRFPLATLEKYQGAPVPIDQLNIAYSRHPNLRNIMSVCKVHNRRQKFHPFLILNMIV